MKNFIVRNRESEEKELEIEAEDVREAGYGYEFIVGNTCQVVFLDTKEHTVEEQ